ncbi:PEP/pyruvate-binding domain-containing protein [Parasporobacterium paucivorans]|uniref:Phosphoenolpyruvate synthase n=1 Tax=Parasporobacterium paucivorans DSM 15970 TaxID=1122934 RepID=A0A1M6GJW9_9FIRM|nr:PEP/pyruvate-binding domain-containing protein [Parasporobacterium paucivorans]SHJ10234.1 Pyruvate phosphate dikinase, PEP/pyruvate binding domain [Parasporobacterium paucivorans DSM 15970]
MGTFERIKSGNPSMDKLLDNIRLGDNVVIQVSSLEAFKIMAQKYVRQAIQDKKSVSYIRFAKHAPLLEKQEGLKVYELNANSGFESFTVEVHKIIEQEGCGAFYVFDCLSDLQVTWSTDLMMGNFFCVTCPYLFRLDTVAWFPVLRGHHDYATIARIQETTQLLLDLYSIENNLYLHPIKVWNRYSSEMYLPHKMSDQDEFESLTNSVDLSVYFRLLQQEHNGDEELNMDSYDRFFREAKAAYYGGTITEWTLNKISRSMMTHDLKMASMIKKEFSPEDFFHVKDRLIGTGTIGGKACGMLLARKMTENYLPEYANYIEPHDSYYIGTDVFYSYIVENGLWEMRIKQRDEKYYFEKAEELRQALLQSSFPETIRVQFRRMLEYFGQIPIIVRSSSFLEDGFGNAFAGKYESVFCANGGNPEERLENFENAVRRVYASTMDRSALEYRRKRGMQQADEQMAILVQRVSGTKFGECYMPCVAGVGFSYSIYRWSEELSADAGLLRLVAGLGTKAVDRTGTDYPRLVNLDKPESTTLVGEDEKHRFSQHKLDLIDTKANNKTEADAYDLLGKLPKWYTDIISEHDFSAERALRDRGQYRPVQFISCQGVVKRKKLMEMMRRILEVLQEHYENPVDTEFTINFREDGEYIVNLLQCRPLQVWQAAAHQDVPEITSDRILFQVDDLFMGNTAGSEVDAVVLIDSKAYHACPYNQKSIFARIVGRINEYYKDSGKKVMLISPGRLGTSSPDLGLCVSFSDISNFSILCEYADAEIGFLPELSFGSHMFQDLVETGMFYTAIMDAKSDRKPIFNKDFWNGEESVLARILPDLENFSEIILVYEHDDEDSLSLFADYKNRRVTCGRFKEIK